MRRFLPPLEMDEDDVPKVGRFLFRPSRLPAFIISDLDKLLLTAHSKPLKGKNAICNLWKAVRNQYLKCTVLTLPTGLLSNACFIWTSVTYQARGFFPGRFFPLTGQSDVLCNKPSRCIYDHDYWVHAIQAPRWEQLCTAFGWSRRLVELRWVLLVAKALLKVSSSTISVFWVSTHQLSSFFALTTHSTLCVTTPAIPTNSERDSFRPKIARWCPKYPIGPPPLTTSVSLWNAFTTSSSKAISGPWTKTIG